MYKNILQYEGGHPPLAAGLKSIFMGLHTALKVSFTFFEIQFSFIFIAPTHNNSLLTELYTVK